MTRRFVAANRLDFMGSHDLRNAMLATRLARFTQVAEHAARAVDATAGDVRVADHAQQALIFDGSLRHGCVQPLIETAARDTQHSAHYLDPKLATVIVDEAVLHSGSLAKYRAAFFRMSRSSSVRRSCARNRRISLLASTSSVACFSVLSGVIALTHL